MTPSFRRKEIVLRHVQQVDSYWTNNKSSTSLDKPTYPTVNGERVEGFAAHLAGYEGETCLERAKRLGVLDVWQFKVVVYFSNRTLVLDDEDEAKEFMEKWNSKKKAKHDRKQKELEFGGADSEAV